MAPSNCHVIDDVTAAWRHRRSMTSSCRRSSTSAFWNSYVVASLISH